MFGFRKRKQQPPSPTWMKWMVAGVLIYGLITGITRPHNGNSPINHALEHAKHGFDNTLAAQYTLFKTGGSDSPEELRVKDIEQGSGTPAICGQDIKIAYESFLPDGQQLGNSASKEKPLSFRIGKHTVMPAFEDGVTGMQKGGKRSILAPPGMAYGIAEFARDDVPKTATVRFEIELLDAAPSAPDLAASPYRSFDVESGSGNLIACGNPVKINLTVWGLDGKKLYENQEPITFSAGQAEVFLGLDQGVIGMRGGAMRTLIVPPAFQKTLSGKPAKIDMHLPLTQTVLVDVRLLP